MRKIIFSIILAIASTTCAVAQTLQACRGTVKEAYDFWFYAPANKSAAPSLTAASKPLVVFLHGASLCGRNLDRVRRYGTIHALEKGLDLDAYVLAPQNSGGSWNPAKLMSLVEWAEQNYSIDANRIYVIGMSLGGYGAVDFTAAYPDRIAATMALCGGGSATDLTGISKTPLWLIHGTADRAVGIACSRRVAQIAGKERCIFTSLPGGNHGTPARIFYMSEAYNWLFAHNLKDNNRPVCRDYSITMSGIRRAYDGLDASLGKQIAVTTWRPKRDFAYTPANEYESNFEEQLDEETEEPISSYNRRVSKANKSKKGKSYHSVRRGDTLSSIAHRYGTTVALLCKLNRITRTSTLSLGSKIRLR